MELTSKSIIKTHNLIEEHKIFNMIVVENYIGSTTSIFTIIVTDIVTATI